MPHKGAASACVSFAALACAALEDAPRVGAVPRVCGGLAGWLVVLVCVIISSPV